MNLRPYQNAAVDAVTAEWRDHKSTLVVLPTGTGKTICFAEILRRAFPRRGLVLAHRQELIDQAADKVRRVTGWRVDIEMGDQRADMSCMFGGPRVVVSTIQTQCSGGDGGGRMTRFDPRMFGVIVVDEGHHSCSASYRRVLDWYCNGNPDLRVLGVTATPDRADEEALGQVYESVAYDYEISDAIRDGWLVPISQKMVHVEGLDFSSCRTTAGDLNGADLARIMEYEANLHKVVAPAIEIAGSKRTLVFAASVEHAERMAEMFNRHKPGMAAWVCGKTDKDDRRRILADFASGRVQVVCNCGVLIEGFDNPAVEVVVMARPTKSRSLYAQMAGRATRPADAIAHELNDHDSPEARRALIEASNKPGCLARGTLILTDYGLIPIEQITVKEKVWDGLAFVTHCGIILRGKRKVVTYAGLTATEDHNVWTKEGWKTFGQCAVEQTPIAVTGNGGETVWEADGCFRRDNQRRCSTTSSILNDRMRMWTKRLKGLFISNFRKSWLQIVRKTYSISSMALAALRICTAEVCQSKRFCLCSLWSTRNHIQFSFPFRYGFVGAEEFGITQRITVRQNRQQQGVYARQSTISKQPSEYGESQKQCNTRNSRISFKISQCWIFRRFFAPILPKRNELERNSQTQTSPSVQREVEVFDILNAGPFHRFTANGLLVSNCLIVDFVGNSGRHKLCTSVDILGGKVSERARELAIKRLAERGGRVDEALEAGAHEEDEEKKREEAKRARLVARAKWTAQTINPFDVMDIKPVAERGWDRGKKLTDKQVNLLRKQGIDADSMPYGQARQLLSELFRRWDGGLCTFGQAKILRKRGLSTDVTRDEAAKLIDGIAAREGWKKRGVA